MAEERYELEIIGFPYKGMSRRFKISTFKFTGMLPNKLYLAPPPLNGGGSISYQAKDYNNVDIVKPSDKESAVFVHTFLRNQSRFGIEYQRYEISFPKISLFIINQNSQQIFDLFEVIVSGYEKGTFWSGFNPGKNYDQTGESEQISFHYKKQSHFAVVIKS